MEKCYNLQFAINRNSIKYSILEHEYFLLIGVQMLDKSQPPIDAKITSDMHLLKIEKDLALLEYKLNKEIPKNLADRLIIIEQRLESLKFEVGKSDWGSKLGNIENDVKVLKESISSEKGRTKERIAFITIIVSLITY